MKPHLPKLLLATLLAVFPMAYAAEYTVTDTASAGTAFANSVAGDTVTFNMTDGNLYFPQNDTTLQGDAIIENLVLNNGFSGKTYIFNGSVSGSGSFTFTNGSADNQTYTFNGSLAGYSGAMEIHSGKYGAFNFNNTTIGGEGAAGSITATNASSKVTLNNSTTYASITSSTVTISGASNVYNTVAASGVIDISGISNAIGGTGTIDVSNGKLNISYDQYSASGGAALFGSGLTVTGLNDASFITVNGITLNNSHYHTSLNDGVLTVSADTLTWNGGADTATWDTSTENWTANGGSTAFIQNDTVLFDSNASVNLSGNINVFDMTVSGNGTTVTIGEGSTGNLIVVHELAIESGSTLILDKGTGGTGLVQGIVTVKEGGTLQFNKHDVTGYNGGTTSLHTINVEKGGQVFQNQAGNETFTGTLNLEGTYNGIDGARLDLYRSSAQIVVGNDNANAAIHVNLCLRRDDAAISVGDNSTLTISGNITKNEGNGIIAKSGAGLLKATGNATINGVTLNGGGVEFAGGGSVGNIKISATDGSVHFTGNGNTYTAGTISTASSDSGNRSIRVGEGATVHATALNNNWGLGSLTVDGTLNLIHETNDSGDTTKAGELVLSSGNVTTEIAGSGTINTYALKVGNNGTYNVSVHELNIGEGGWSKNEPDNDQIPHQTLHLKEDSTVNLNGQASNVRVTMEGGTLNINDTTREHTFAMIDAASSGDGVGGGTVHFKSGTTTSITTLWERATGAELLLEETAKVKLANATVTITGQESGSEISSTDNTSYSATNGNWTFANATVTVEDVSNGSLGTRLDHSSLINMGGTAVIATNEHSTYDAIEARESDITIRTGDSGATADSLYVGQDKTVTFAKADDTTTKVTLSQSATLYGAINGGISWAAAEGAANTLILNTVYDGDSSILTSIAVGSTINFGSEGKIVLDTDGAHSSSLKGKNLTLQATYTLNQDIGAGSTLETRWLIEGSDIYFRDCWGNNNPDNTLVNFSTFSLVETGGTETIRFDAASSLDAAWLINGTEVELTAGAYRYVATADGIGVQYYQNLLPEPSTATLSLLALAALAARRRRKG